jgi:ABC-type sulfate transport system permease subunit
MLLIKLITQMVLMLLFYVVFFFLVFIPTLPAVMVLSMVFQHDFSKWYDKIGDPIMKKINSILPDE